MTNKDAFFLLAPDASKIIPYIEVMTITKSKILKPSSKNVLRPKPMTLSTNSTVNTNVNAKLNKLNMYRVVGSCSGYLSKQRMTVFRMITHIINALK